MEGYGLSVMSIGFLIEEETPMIWRGPMVMSALTQMLREVEWGTLDVMVVDMPPGTGDAQLTMAQQVPLRGAVIVSTPQDLALIDARRGVAHVQARQRAGARRRRKHELFLCARSAARARTFSRHGGARHEAERLGVPFLGEVPLHMDIREKSDSGRPVVRDRSGRAACQDLSGDRGPECEMRSRRVRVLPRASWWNREQVPGCPRIESRRAFAHCGQCRRKRRIQLSDEPAILPAI